MQMEPMVPCGPLCVGTGWAGLCKSGLMMMGQPTNWYWTGLRCCPIIFDLPGGFKLVRDRTSKYAEAPDRWVSGKIHYHRLLLLLILLIFLFWKFCVIESLFYGFEYALCLSHLSPDSFLTHKLKIWGKMAGSIEQFDLWILEFLCIRPYLFVSSMFGRFLDTDFHVVGRDRILIYELMNIWNGKLEWYLNLLKIILMGY